MLRISEVAQGQHGVLAQDVHIGFNEKKLLFILRSSKMHTQGNQPQLVKISSRPKPGNGKGQNHTKMECPCPYELLRQYACQRGPYHDDSDKFFVFSDGSPIPAKAIQNCFKSVLKEAGYDHKLYGTHGFRAGRSCDLLKLGLSIETIKKLGRWKSNGVFKYMRYYTT